MKYRPENPKRFASVRVYRDGETVMEYFATRREAEAWIARQTSPKDDSFFWAVGQWCEQEVKP